ncbi:MAG: hypothetical protein PPFGHCPK_01392 (plasmid) [Spiroplasma endosymbiont of Drosophila atripex]|nr:MAG: hypothetical protein PPFGHCPK_01392 [Spiroplasma endosymbiont of Drosophila atripex]
MKKLLTTIILSALLGTSTSNLKPMFVEKIVNTGFKSEQLNNKNISIQGENDNPFVSPIINAPKNILSIAVTSDGTIWIGSDNGLYRSTNSNTFNKVMNEFNVNSILITSDKIIWVGTGNGLYKSTDNGTTFNKIISSQNFINSWKFAPDKTIWASSNIGLYKSTDEKTLTRIQLAGTAPKTNLEITLNGSIYVSVNGDGWDNSGLYKSVDGEKFNKISSLSGKEWLQNNKNINAVKSSNNGTIYVGTEVGLYKSTDGTIFTRIKDMKVESINIDDGSDKIIWVGTGNGLYKSTDNGTTFNKIMNNDNTITVVKSSNNGTIYVGKYKGLYKIDLLNNVFDSFSSKNKPDYFGNKYNGFVYKNEQIIELKPDYLKNATLDGVTIDVSSKQKITIGIKHNLVLTLNNKDNCNQYLDLFGGDPTNGQITYNFWIKNEIGKDEFNYSTITHDTDLLTGLVANISTANTYNSPIIQTRQKDGSGVITLNTQVISEMINLETSYYEQGTINDTTNDFSATGSKQKMKQKLTISSDGIYHLHLVDMVGNTYDSYLELGEKNWKLKGTFDDKTFNDLANTLNVIVNIISIDDKKLANGWLNNYKNLADSTFNNTVLSKGKGFIITIDNDLKADYKSFLDLITYVNSKTQYAINQTKLNDEIIKIAKQKLKNGLNGLPQNLNVDTKNVVNKSTLDSYTSWISGYDNFINKNKDEWINNKAIIAGRGFASREQIDKIKTYINSLNFKEYLKPVEWSATTGLATSNDYQQFVELDKLQNDTIDWVNREMSEINQAYQQAIKNAESGLNLHGYSIDEILKGKSKPQTKSEIENFADSQNYHDWLQSQANIKFHGWQLKIGLPIAIISLVIIVVAGIFIRRRTNPKYNPFRWERKKEKQHSKLSKSINSSKNKKSKNKDK